MSIKAPQTNFNYPNMKKKISFVQIAVSYSDGIYNTLGLHKNGSVWQYTHLTGNNAYWIPLKMEAEVGTEEQAKALEE